MNAFITNLIYFWGSDKEEIYIQLLGVALVVSYAIFVMSTIHIFYKKKDEKKEIINPIITKDKK